MSVSLSGISFEIKTSKLSINELSFQIYGCVFLHNLSFEISDDDVILQTKIKTSNGRIIKKNNKILVKYLT